jgi:uncharacterized membrane protein SirB2
MLKAFHIALALLSVSGFVMRVGWSFVAPDINQRKWVRIAPHVIDTFLLVLGLWLAFNLVGGMMQPWLIAKLTALFVYIGFGVLALRGQGPLRYVGIFGAFIAVGYIFVVAFTRNAWFV